jgi:hypothetical protein
VALLLIGGAVLTYALVSGDDDSDPTTTTTTDVEPTEDEPTSEEPTVEEPTEESPTLEEPTDESPTVEEPTDESPTVEEPTPPEGTSNQALIDVAGAYAAAVGEGDCETAKSLAAETLLNSGGACGDDFTQDVLADFEPTNPEVMRYDLIDAASVTFTFGGGKTAYVSLTTASGAPLVDVMYAY